MREIQEPVQVSLASPVIIIIIVIVDDCPASGELVP